MTTAMKRPKTSHSNRRSGCRDPKLAWEAEDSLQVTKVEYGIYTAGYLLVIYRLLFCNRYAALTFLMYTRT